MGFSVFFFFSFFLNVIAAMPQLATQLLGLIKVRTTEPTGVPKTQNSTISQPIPPITLIVGRHVKWCWPWDAAAVGWSWAQGLSSRNGWERDWEQCRVLWLGASPALSFCFHTKVGYERYHWQKCFRSCITQIRVFISLLKVPKSF